jgi:hypothetical protein
VRPDGCATGSTSAWWLITSEIEGIQLAWLADESVDMAAHLEQLMALLRAPSPAER